MRTMAAVVGLCLVGGCSGATSFGVPYLSLGVPDHARRLGRVEGNDCSFAYGGAVSQDISARVAMEHALEGTMADGIVDAEVSQDDRFGETCIQVSGTAVRVVPR